MDYEKWKEVWTNREQHKSAPFLSLENSTKTSECQVFPLTVPEKPKFGPNWRAECPIVQPAGALKGGPIRILLSQNIEKIERGPFGENDFLANVTMPKQTGTEDTLV